MIALLRLDLNLNKQTGIAWHEALEPLVVMVMRPDGNFQKSR